jgi:hypothetical protein
MFEPLEPAACKPDIDVIGEAEYNTLISAEVMLPMDGFLQPAKVTQRKHDMNGNPVGTPNSNPILDSGIYEVTFQDGRTNEYAANVIIENILQQVDAEGNSFTYFSEVTDHQDDDTAMNIDNGYVLKNGDLVPVKTTKGWYLQIAWKDGTTTWEPLRDLNEVYPIEVAEYAIANKIDKQLAFVWWIPYVLNKRNRVIAAAKAR